MPSPSEKRRAFRDLHATGCFVIPNPWDVGTARWLQHTGFPALATTSAGLAFSAGRPDWEVPLDAMLAHVRTIVESTDVPVNADFENGYADEPDAVAANVRACAATGVAGLSIEDATGDPARPLYERALAVDRVRAAVAAARPSGTVLTARTECFLAGRPDIDEATARLSAFAEAGAECLYAPGVRTREEIAAVLAAVAPKPVNVLMSAPTGLTLADLAALGVRRVSVGSALARAAWGGFVRAAREIAREGRFDGLADAIPFAELNAFFRDDLVRRARREAP